MYSFLISERAASMIKKISDGGFLRVKVEGGGCNGLKYVISIDNALMEGDVEFLQSGAKVIIDRDSIEYLNGAELNYMEDLSGASFSVKNAKFSSKCGCGESFSYE